MMNFRALRLFADTKPVSFSRGYGTIPSLAPLGEKSAYTDKQLRQAHHIEESLEDRGVPHKQAIGIAWATVNKTYGGGLREKGSAFDRLKETNPDKLIKELQDDNKVDRKQYVDTHSGRGHVTNEDLWATKPPHNLALEDYIQKGGKIVSEHSNIRGDEYHTVVVQLPDGHKQAFSNVKTESLQKILGQQSEYDRNYKLMLKAGQVGGQQAQTPWSRVHTERPSRHIAFEDYINQGARIVSEHPNIRGQEYHTVVLELQNGRRQAFANVKANTLETILQHQGAQGQSRQVPQFQQAAPQQQAPIQTAGRTKFEEYMKKGGTIVSDHPNIRGEEYHTVVVQLPDGHKQAFSNVKSDLLEQILMKQQTTQQATAGQQPQPNIDFGRLPPDTALEELIKQGARITTEHPYPVKGAVFHSVFLQLGGRMYVLKDVKDETWQRIRSLMQGQEPKKQEDMVHQRASEQVREIGERGHTGYYRGAVFEDAIKQGGMIVSDHSNIRGQEYHTVTVESANGRRQTFTNIKSETLERVLGEQEARGATFEQHREAPLHQDVVQGQPSYQQPTSR